MPFFKWGKQMIYADAEYYKQTYNGDLIQDKDLDRSLKRASQQLDSLTFNRINQIGFDCLTAFQREVIQESTCRLADFNIENEDMLTSILSTYSINGVSAGFETSMTVESVNGVILSPDIYSYLSQSGLCCLSLGGW